MENHNIKIEEDKTHRSLMARGSIPNTRYKRSTIVSTPIEIQDTKEHEKQEVWESCCLRVDPHGIAYFGQYTISLLVLGVSTYMLIKADGDCNKSSPYIGLISFLLGKILSSVVSSSS